MQSAHNRQQTESKVSRRVSVFVYFRLHLHLIASPCTTHKRTRRSAECVSPKKEKKNHPVHVPRFIHVSPLLRSRKCKPLQLDHKLDRPRRWPRIVSRQMSNKTQNSAGGAKIRARADQERKSKKLPVYIRAGSRLARSGKSRHGQQIGKLSSMSGVGQENKIKLKA